MSDTKVSDAQRYANQCLDWLKQQDSTNEKTEFALKLLVGLASNYELVLVPKQEVIPGKLNQIMAYVEANISGLSDSQRVWYKRIRDYFDKEGFLTKSYQNMLVSFYITLEGITIRFEDY